MKKILQLLVLFLLIQSWQPLFAQSGVYIWDPIDGGTYGSCSGGSFSDTRNNSSSYGFMDQLGQSSPEIYYTFTLTTPGTVTISTCGSGLYDTYLHLLDAYGNEIASDDDYGPSCASYQASIQTTLAAGTYYVAAEGYSYNTGDITTTITVANSGGGSAPAGAYFSNAIDAGTLVAGSPFSSTLTNSDCYGNDFSQPTNQPSNDIFYKFTLSNSGVVSLSHCGSPIDTYMHLLDASGTEITYDDDNGPLCTGLQASIQTTLAAGTYYVVSEGWSTNSGSIATTISVTYSSGSSCAPLGTPSPNQNYVQTLTPRVPISNAATLASQSICDVNQTIQYFDGLGRPIQTVQVKASPGFNDIVQSIVYDQYGRETTKYLPYANNPVVASDGSFKSDAISIQQPAFYSGAWATNVVQTPNPSASTAFEASPINRPLEQGAPGASWQLGAHTVKAVYAANDAPGISAGTGFWAKQYDVSITSGAPSLIDNGAYTANTLYVTVNKDENWQNGQGYPKDHTTEEYKDMDGRTVLKRTFNGANILSTYYVYDDYGNLSFVLPPGANPDAGLSSATNQAILDTWCYQYRYDERNRQVEKKIPGKDWEYLVYNKLDQVVYTQNGVQRPNHQWSWAKYDGLGRVVLTGVENNNTMSRQTVQYTYVNTMTGPIWEERTTARPDGYTARTHPMAGEENSNIKFLTVNYYDDYNFPANPYSCWGSYQSSPKGLPTGTETTVLNPDGSYGPKLWVMNYYDDKGRVIQTSKQHYLGGNYNTGNYDVILITYNFDNQPSTNNHYHFTVAGGSTPALRMDDAFFYDHTGRKYQIWTAINNATSILQSQLDYNEIGQLKTNHLHSENNGAGFLQDVNYSYNERGWLRTSGTSANNIATNLFNLDLRYDNPGAGTQQFNGNISQMFYNGQYSGSKQFNYTYDALNRLTAASSTGGTLDETINYDNTGNITTLNRGGSVMGTLNYTSYTGNQLNTVTGYSPRNYTYDLNGSATSDGAGKGIDYNILDLPRSIRSGGNQIATYTYDASGNKIRKIGTDGTWDYINGIVYHNNTIAFIATEQGKAMPNGNTYKYVYDLKDHLGNVRVTFDKNISTGQAEVVQEDEYYSFGLRHGLYDNSNGNRYLYNGKEIQTDLAEQYDYGARFYDPVIARWTSVDPLAEKSRRWSTYTYCFNNPIRNIDPDGMEALSNEEVAERLKRARDAAQAKEQAANFFASVLIPTSLLGPNTPVNAGVNDAESGEPDASSKITSDNNDEPNVNESNENTNQGGDRYNGYDKSIPVENYNCAGLAFRTYQWIGLEDVKSILNANKIAGRGNEGDIKVWLWTYNVTMVLKDGTKLSTPSADFHIVAGRLGSNGKDPINVYSKNGGRPIFGPASGQSFKPLPLEPAYSNDRFNKPGYYQGQQVMKLRTEIIQQVFIIPYKQY
jgi:RHS repeat-associated protein